MDDNVIEFKPKPIKDGNKYFGSISITEDFKVKVDMEDKSMILDGKVAYDIAIVMLIAAKFVITKEYLQTEE